jgi:uncharacterized protein with HEPN domain
MSRDYRIYLHDILEAIDRIHRYVDGYTLLILEGDSKTADAVIHNLSIIGEAVKNIPSDFRKLYPEVEWKKIAGLRDVLIHSYFDIDLEIIWDIIDNKLNPLEAQVKAILANMDKEQND